MTQLRQCVQRGIKRDRTASSPLFVAHVHQRFHIHSTALRLRATKTLLENIMSSRALLSDLPKIPVCTVRELLTVASCAHSKVNDDFPFRRVVQLPNRREIIVVMHARSLELFAMDRFCYHAGYPMDDGDIEDIPVREPVFSSSSAAPASAAEAELARQSALAGSRRTGSVDFATRDAQFTHMSKALLLLRAKGTQQQAAAIAAPATEEPTSAGGVAGATLSNEMLKLVRAGTLEADYDDPAKFHGDDSYAFPIITCKLHNRIFDLRTGDMITRAVEDVDDGSSGVKGKAKKCVVSESTGCHQRIHPVTIEREGEDGDGVIFVHDTFGYSIPMRRPGAPVNMATREHLMFLANKKIMSDRENLPREPKKPVADAAPAAVPTG